MGNSRSRSRGRSSQQDHDDDWGAASRSPRQMPCRNKEPQWAPYPCPNRVVQEVCADCGIEATSHYSVGERPAEDEHERERRLRRYLEDLEQGVVPADEDRLNERHSEVKAAIESGCSGELKECEADLEGWLWKDALVDWQRRRRRVAVWRSWKNDAYKKFTHHKTVFTFGEDLLDMSCRLVRGTQHLTAEILLEDDKVRLDLRGPFVYMMGSESKDISKWTKDLLLIVHDITVEDLNDICVPVWQEFGSYSKVSNNCQHFCERILKRLQAGFDARRPTDEDKEYHQPDRTRAQQAITVGYHGWLQPELWSRLRAPWAKHRAEQLKSRLVGTLNQMLLGLVHELSRANEWTVVDDRDQPQPLDLEERMEEHMEFWSTEDARLYRDLRSMFGSEAWAAITVGQHRSTDLTPISPKQRSSWHQLMLDHAECIRTLYGLDHDDSIQTMTQNMEPYQWLKRSLRCEGVSAGVAIDPVWASLQTLKQREAGAQMLRHKITSIREVVQSSDSCGDRSLQLVVLGYMANLSCVQWDMGQPSHAACTVTDTAEMLHRLDINLDAQRVKSLLWRLWAFAKRASLCKQLTKMYASSNFRRLPPAIFSRVLEFVPFCGDCDWTATPNLDNSSKPFCTKHGEDHRELAQLLQENALYCYFKIKSSR